MIDELRNVDIEGFFPTPDAVIDMMLAAADMHDGQTVLEPSAGIGSICDRVKQAFPHTDLDAVELRDSLAKILVAKGHAVVGRDFTAWNGNGRQYDRVLMNPPFEKGADMAHVRQAFNHVKPGGRLVAIMSNGFRFRQTSRATGFRAWLEEMDGDVVELPDDAFNGSNAFRKTGVKAVMVAVQKPGWQVSEQADIPASKAGDSTHPGQPAGQESQVAQDGPKRPQRLPPTPGSNKVPARPQHRRFLRAKRRLPRIQTETRIQNPKPNPTQPERIPAASNNRRNRTKNAATATCWPATSRPGWQTSTDRPPSSAACQPSPPPLIPTPSSSPAPAASAKRPPPGRWPTNWAAIGLGRRGRDPSGTQDGRAVEGWDRDRKGSRLRQGSGDPEAAAGLWGQRMAQLGAGFFERGVSEGDRDVVLRGPEGGRERAARCRRSGWRSPPAVHVHLRCSHDSMAGTGTEAPASGKRAAERGAERGRGVKRSNAPPAASEEVDGQPVCETGRRDLPCGSSSEGRTGFLLPEIRHRVARGQ